MKLIVLVVLAVVAAARADYHDDVFHFSTLRSPVALSSRPPAYQRSSYNHFNNYQNHYSAEPNAYYSQYTPSVSSANAYYSAAVPSNNVYYTQYTPAISNAYHTQYTQYTPVYSPAISASAAYHHAPAQFYQRSTPAAPAVVVDYSNKPTVGIQAPAVAYGTQVPLPSSSHYSLGNLYARRASYAPAYNYRILKHVQEVDPSGPYRSQYATENGITASEEGSLVGGGPEGPAVAKQGTYSYTGPDGVVYSVNWVADEYGFRASGAHLPQA